MTEASQSTLSLSEAQASAPMLALTVVHHPDRSFLGERLELSSPTEQVIGRGDGGFERGEIADRTISSRHAIVRTAADGSTLVEDLRSRNGTRKNGAEIERARLQAGDVLALGRVMMVVDAEARPEAPRRLGEFVGFSPAAGRIFRVATRLGDQPAPRCVWGDAGTGRRTLARALLEGSAPLILDASQPGAPRDLQRASPERALIVHAFERGADGLTSTLQRRLENSALGEVVLVSAADPAALARDGNALAARSLPWSFHLPPLAQRPADVAALAWEFAERYAGEGAELMPQLLLELLACRWPSNASGLEAVVERAALHSDSGAVDVFPGLGRLLLGSPSEPLPAPAAATLRVARDYAWYERDGAPRVGVGHGPARRVLGLLIERHIVAPAAVLDVEVLFGHAWPGQDVVPRSRTNRVHSVLTGLRRAGLREVVQRVARGYRLNPDIVVDVAL